MIKYNTTEFYFTPNNNSIKKLEDVILNWLVHAVSASMRLVQQWSESETMFMRFEFKLWKAFERTRFDKPRGSLHKLSDLISVYPKIKNLDLQNSYYAQCLIGNEMIESVISPDFFCGEKLKATEVPISDEALVKQQRQQCANCGIAGDPKACSRCRKVKYCNLSCQRSHWKTHKPDCVRF